MAVKRKISKVGLNKSGRIDWDDWINCAVAFWAERRFHGRFIAAQTGLTVGQVYERCRRYGIGLRNARDGEGANSEAITKNYGAETITRARKAQVTADYPNPDEE